MQRATQMAASPFELEHLGGRGGGLSPVGRLGDHQCHPCRMQDCPQQELSYPPTKVTTLCLSHHSLMMMGGGVTQRHPPHVSITNRKSILIGNPNGLKLPRVGIFSLHFGHISFPS